jgi:hypothetical protein
MGPEDELYQTMGPEDDFANENFYIMSIDMLIVEFRFITDGRWVWVYRHFES